MVNSRAKGCRGELSFAKMLREKWGCEDAHRGRQYSGGADSPDVCKGVPGTHAEVKNTERPQLYKAMEQAKAEAAFDEIPYVAFKSNRKKWLIVVEMEDMADFAIRLAKHLRTSRVGDSQAL